MVYIKSITLFNYKSYSSRTTIPFSPQITTITGDNGCGKSNIIDAILFVLGGADSRIKSLSEVVGSAANYCEVILRFNDQTTISRYYDGKSRYKLNNMTVTFSTVSNYLAALNVTDPDYFSIGQGKIVKLDMNLESLVERTARVFNYEQRKHKCVQSLDAKERQLVMIRDVIDRRVRPFISKLVEERKNQSDLLKAREMEKEIAECQERIKAGRMAALASTICEKIREYLWLRSGHREGESEDNTSVLDAILSKKEELKRMAELERRMRGLTLEYNEVENEYLSLVDEEKVLLSSLRKDVTYEDAAKMRERMEEMSLSARKAAGRIFGPGVAPSTATAQLAVEAIAKSVGVPTSSMNKDSLADVPDEGVASLVRAVASLESGAGEYPIFYQKISGEVFGTVEENFVAVDPKYDEAISVILGARRSFVIVRDEDTATRLLKASSRISVIPLNRIVLSNKGISMESVAEKYFGGSLQSASSTVVPVIDLVHYNQAVAKAMLFAFGNAFLVKDARIAGKVAFTFHVKCVTEDGTIYDPRGTVSGGRARGTRRGPWPCIVLQYNEVRNAIRSQGCAPVGAIEVVNPVQMDSVIPQIKRAVLSLEYLNMAKKVRNISVQLSSCSESSATRRRLEEVQRRIPEEARKYKENRRNFERAKRSREEFDEISKKLEMRGAILEEVKMLEAKMEHRLDRSELIKRIVDCKREIGRMNREYSDMACSDDDGYRVDDELAVSSLLSGMEDAAHIEVQSVLESISPDEKRVKSLSEQLRRIGKGSGMKMDPKNYEFLEKNELMLSSLNERLDKLESDRVRIKSSMSRLDKMSMDEKEKAFAFLRTKIGSILRKFIPDSDVAIDNYMLRVKIGTWKNDVSELSGGQKSLVCLSMLFAMLSYNTASFYLLDEIDSALDANYASKLAEMISAEFKKTQFIIVSLRSETVEKGSTVYSITREDGHPIIKLVKPG